MRGGTVVYKWEPLTKEVEKEMMEMADLYWKDVSAPFHSFPPDPDWPMYEDMQKQNRLRMIIGRDDEGKVKALAIAVTGHHPHYACVTASLPLFFLHPDHRKGMEGIRLLKEIEKLCEASGVQLFSTHGGIHNNVNKIFEFEGFEDFGRYYVKVLRNGPLGTTPVFKRRRDDG
jgi:hypothetical protein